MGKSVNMATLLVAIFTVQIWFGQICTIIQTYLEQLCKKKYRFYNDTAKSNTLVILTTYLPFTIRTKESTAYLKKSSTRVTANIKIRTYYQKYPVKL